MWSPWASVASESSALQLMLVISFFFFVSSRSFFYSLLYLFVFFIWVGLFTAYYGVEMFTGFFWVVELSVFFILLLFIFFLNYSSELRRSPSYYGPAFFCSALALVPMSDDYSVSVGLLNFSSLYEDYYYSMSSSSMSDVHGLYLSYYVFNSLLLVVFGLFVFIVSVVCVILLKSSQATYAESASAFLGSYKFFEDLLSFEFLRSQNLNIQVLRRPNSRVLSRRQRGWSKKKQD